MAKVSPSGLNICVADRVVLNYVILNHSCLGQKEVLAFISVLNLSAFWDPWHHLEMMKLKFM